MPDNIVNDLKKLNSRVEDIVRAIAHEQQLITDLEDRRKKLEREKGEEVRTLLNEIEENKRRLRDLEYQEKDIRGKKTDLESVYSRERIEKLSHTLQELTEKRDKITKDLVPRMEERLDTLKERVTELDAEILRINGKIRFLSGKQ